MPTANVAGDVDAPLFAFSIAMDQRTFRVSFVPIFPSPLYHPLLRGAEDCIDRGGMDDEPDACPTKRRTAPIKQDPMRAFPTTAL